MKNSIVHELRVYLCDAPKYDGKKSIKVDELPVGPASLSLLLYDGIFDPGRAVSKIKDSWKPWGFKSFTGIVGQCRTVDD